MHLLRKNRKKRLIIQSSDEKPFGGGTEDVSDEIPKKRKRVNQCSLSRG